MTVQLEGYPYHQLPQCFVVAMWAAFHGNCSYGLAFSLRSSFFSDDFFMSPKNLIFRYTVFIKWVFSVITWVRHFLNNFFYFSKPKYYFSVTFITSFVQLHKCTKIFISIYLFFMENMCRDSSHVMMKNYEKSTFDYVLVSFNFFPHSKSTKTK